MARMTLDSDDSDEERDKTPKVPWRTRIENFPRNAWHWMHTNKIKTLILLLVLALIVFIIVEIVKGAVTNVLTTVLVEVNKLGPGVRSGNCKSLNVG